MRLRNIDWETVWTTAVTALLTCGALFAGYKGYEDHLILQQVVGYLNAQAQAQQPKVIAQPNVQTNPEPAKKEK